MHGHSLRMRLAFIIQAPPAAAEAAAVEEAAAIAPQGAAIASKGACHKKLGSFQRLDALGDYWLILMLTNGSKA